MTKRITGAAEAPAPRSSGPSGKAIDPAGPKYHAPLALLDGLRDAAASKHLTLSAYVRRALAAQISTDLGVPVSDLLPARSGP